MHSDDQCVQVRKLTVKLAFQSFESATASTESVSFNTESAKLSAESMNFSTGNWVSTLKIVKNYKNYGKCELIWL